jgi:PAS domain S-box-containing protein
MMNAIPQPLPARARTDAERLLDAAERLSQSGSWELDLRSGEVRLSAGLCRIFGMPADDRVRDLRELVARVHPHDRPRIEALLGLVGDGPQLVASDGLTFAFRLVREDGTIREVRAHGHVTRGAPARWVGVIHDLTDRRLTERELQAHFVVSQTLRDGQLAGDAAALLRGLGAALDYPMGALWLCDDDAQALAFEAFWSATPVDTTTLEAALRRLQPRRHAIGSSRAWRAQEPQIVGDISRDPAFRPRDAALALGITSAISIPAIGPDGPLALVCFYSCEPRLASDSLARTLTAIGRDLGYGLAGLRARSACRLLTERELDVLRLAAHGNNGPQIAERLCITPSTVKTHLAHIYGKLGVGDRAAAVAVAVRAGVSA